MLRLYGQKMSPTEFLLKSAIEFFDVDTVEKLLKSDLEIEDNDRYTVLHTAAELIDPETMINCGEEVPDEHLTSLYRLEALQQIIKAILESGRYNVNALAASSETALHTVVGYCWCKHFYCDVYSDLINGIIKLLLKNNANINAKTSEGETPLMKASELGCSHVVHVLLDWRDERGARVDLNARDIYGQTALIKAAKYAHVDVVELLLKHGCSYEIQDQRGFYALHAVIYGSELISNASKDFLALTGVLGAEKTTILLKRYAAHSERAKAICMGWAKNDLIQETVSMLMTRGRADINSKDFGGNTVLDLALQSKVHISQKTVRMLKEYGATSGILLNKHLEYQNVTLHYTDKLGKTPLHRLSAVLPELALGKKVEIFMHRLNSSHHKEAFEEMTIAKDHRGRTALHYAVTDAVIDVTLKPEDIWTLINVLKLKPTINERDNYGRIPLHYCQDEDVYRSLVEQGTNEHIQDIDGKTPRDLKKLRNEEHNRYNLPGKLQDQLNQVKIEAWMIWKDSYYPYRDKFSRRIRHKVRQFMNRLSEGIREKDPRFECRPVLIGSAEEGTKIGLPDEFDFNFILIKLSEVCEAVPSPEAPSGFVHLKRRYNNAEYSPQNQHIESHEDFDEFFNRSGFLLTTEIVCRFRILFLQIMREQEFWEGEDFFEWDPQNEAGMIYDKRNRRFNSSPSYSDHTPSIHPCSTIQLKLNRPIEGRYMFTLISLDIVPCIKINGWWPEEALSGVNDETKDEGCHLVFDEPQRNYPWVPFSDPFARISFAPAESRMIRECSAVARAAYMIGKQLIRDTSELTYVLKTCLLYCIEALKDCTNTSLMYEDINPAELRFFVEKLMLCLHEFYQQDFLPCYMMPSFHLPIQGYMKSNHDNPYNSNVRFPLFAHWLYSSVCTTESPENCCPPTLEPLGEKFNREELMRKLSMDRSSIEYRRVQPESHAKGQILRSENQSGSQARLSTNKRGLRMNQTIPK